MYSGNTCGTYMVPAVNTQDNMLSLYILGCWYGEVQMLHWVGYLPLLKFSHNEVAPKVPYSGNF